MKSKKPLLILSIIILALVLRVWDFGNNPAGVYVDEASLGYNAYSLLKTGKDEYGASWPIFLRSFGTYQSALYTYLSIPFIKIIGLSSVGVRTLSLISGLALVVLVCFWMGPIEALIVAISPVFVFFSRGAFEANLALSLFIAGLLLSIKAKKHSHLLFFGLTLLSISAYAYHAERFLSLFFIFFFSLIYFFSLKTNRRQVILAFFFALAIQLPLLLISLKSGTNARLSGLLYQGNSNILGFLKHYFVYLSPNNLFSRPDPELQRSFPDLSVFYWWMFPLLLAGVIKIYQNRLTLTWSDKIMILLLFVAILPGAITKEYFSTLRVLPIFIPLSWIIAQGWQKLFKHRPWLSLFFVLIACFQLYSGLTLLKHERSAVWGYQYHQLVEKLTPIEDRDIIIDNARLAPIYILFAFYQKIDPEFIQQWHGPTYLDNYYNHPEFNPNQRLKNIEFRSIFWEDDIYQEQYLVGDNISISDEQMQEHKLELIDTIKDINGQEVLRILKTNPAEKRHSTTVSLDSPPLLMFN